MANVKYFGEFRSSRGHFYLIEIWDEDYTGSDPIKFNVTSDGFRLNYSGQTDNIYSPIIGSSASFGMYVENDDHTAFVNSLKLYQENRYYIKIWKGDFDGQDANQWYNTTKVSNDGLVMSFTDFEEEEVYLNFKWGGYIVQDILEIEDAPLPYVLEIQATDGINKLKNVDGGTGFTPIDNIFTNAVFNAYTHNIFPTEWPMLKMVANWWSEQHTYNADENPLETTVIDLNVFHNYDGDGNLNAASYYDVLEGVCRIFGLRFYFADGSFRAEQIFQRDNDNIKEFAYKRNGNYISNATVTRDKTIDQTSDAARLSGNIYNFLPALNKTTIRTEEGDIDYSGIISNTTTQPTIDLGYTTDTPKNWLEITFDSRVDLDVDTHVNSQFIYYIAKVDVTIDDGSTTYYLKRPLNGINPGLMEWTTTQAGSGYEYVIGRAIEGLPTGESSYSYFAKTTKTIVTPTLPQDGDIEIEFDGVKWITQSGATRTLNANNSSEWETRTLKIQKMNGNNGHIVVAETTNADNESGIVYDLGKTKIFDGAGNRGSLFERDPSTLVNTLTTGWREGNSGSYVTAQRLVCNEFLRLMNKPVQRYQGGIYSAHDFSDRLVFNSLNWLQLGGTFTANSDTWDGEWFAIALQTIAITNSDDGTADVPVFSVGAGSYDGRPTLGAIDAMDFSAIDAQIDNDLDVSGNTDLTGTLDVTGASTLDTTSVGEFTTTDRVNVTINDITATPGGNETLSLSNHFNFITYSGANGVYTVNLPAAEDGVMLRFKTDDTISNSKSITLQPNGGERIDGEASYSMDRAFDGITVFGKNSGWYIAQKKEK